MTTAGTILRLKHKDGGYNLEAGTILREKGGDRNFYIVSHYNHRVQIVRLKDGEIYKPLLDNYLEIECFEIVKNDVLIDPRAKHCWEDQKEKLSTNTKTISLAGELTKPRFSVTQQIEPSQVDVFFDLGNSTTEINIGGPCKLTLGENGPKITTDATVNVATQVTIS